MSGEAAIETCPCEQRSAEGTSATCQNQKVLQILDLPLDILKAILREMRDSDLTSLALVCHTMHSLVIPVLYRRFDIVWPDEDARSEPKEGPDALTFGLSTLAIRDDLYDHHADPPLRTVEFDQHHNVVVPKKDVLPKFVKSRRGNCYSQYVRTFSLSNGPKDMVKDYVITSEKGKLLGTLAALCLARMPNLEKFMWDLPSGIVRDTWISLASLGDRQPTKLEKVHVRFHNNAQAYKEAGLVRWTGSTTGPPPPSGPAPAGPPMNLSLVYSNNYVESPNFSILPPLKYITALTIDEIENLHELSLLIGKSAEKLRELKVGMGKQLNTSGLSVDDADNLLFDMGGGGTLKYLFAFLPRIRANNEACGTSKDATQQGEDSPDSKQESVSTDANDNQMISTAVEEKAVTCKDVASPDEENLMDSIDPALASPEATARTSENEASQADPAPKACKVAPATIPEAWPKSIPLIHTSRTNDDAQKPDQTVGNWPVQKLRLETLALERHRMVMRTLTDSIDWTILTSLTLLGCVETTDLFGHLTTEFAPFQAPKSFIDSISPTSIDKKTHAKSPRLRRMPSSPRTATPPKPIYRLNLKRLHTDTVSANLLTFLTTTLAPNTLEQLFLQDHKDFKGPVSTTQIYNGPVKRHRRSLTKLLIDSYDQSHLQSHKKWLPKRDQLAHLLSPNKFPVLRELSLSLEYKDYHFFLQHLPNIATLRTLHIPYLAKHIWGNAFNARDVAKCVVDVVNVRQECQLAYLAIEGKCFEIVERMQELFKRKGKGNGQGGGEGGVGAGTEESSSEDFTPGPSDEDDDSASDSEAGDEGQQNGEDTVVEDEIDGIGEESDSEDEVPEAGRKPLVKMKLREILFFDKIDVFRARHGKL